MTYEHNLAMDRLLAMLYSQLDTRSYQIRPNASRTRRGDDSYFIPDIFVLPVSLANHMAERSRAAAPNHPLEVYSEPLPLVVEVWSRSTGRYDVDTKLPEYQRRGDIEIWRIHPYEHTLTAWRRQPDGRYTEAVYTSGVIEPAALPGVRIVIDELFA
jgi:Uma2 family endonuclease